MKRVVDAGRQQRAQTRRFFGFLFGLLACLLARFALLDGLVD